MSKYDYEISKKIAAADFSFYGLIMAAMRQADTDNLAQLRAAFPLVYTELIARRNAPGGILPGDDQAGLDLVIEDITPDRPKRGRPKSGKAGTFIEIRTIRNRADGQTYQWQYEVTYENGRRVRSKSIGMVAKVG